jgi:outer membrane protein assembly factor BamD (BamD/ComL family)
MAWFRILCLFFAAAAAGCSKPTAEEYFARAQKQAQTAATMADTLRSPDAVREAFGPAIGLFQSVIREYPHHPLAEASIFEIANIQNSNLHMPREAIEGYSLYCREYPAGKQTPLAMFLIGYLYNNELHNSDSAAAAYRRFLDRYPGSEMAASARFELDNLGKSPEEAIPIPPPGPESKRGKKQTPQTPV